MRKPLIRATRPFMPGYDMMFDRKKGSLPWSWAAKRLSTSHNYWLATTRPEGRPHVMPVWGVWLDNSFYFSTGRRSRKSLNLRANPNCTVCPETAAEAVILEGDARRITDPSRLHRFAVAYKKKYNWDTGDIENSKDPFYSVRPRVVFGFIESSNKISGNPTRWTFR